MPKMLSARTRLRHAILDLLQMAPHIHAQIRPASDLSLTVQDLPVITVSLDKASILTDWTVLDTTGQLIETIEQPIIIKITATGNDELEERLEALALNVSQTFASHETLNGLVKTLRLEDDAELSISHEGEQPIGVLTLRFVALYRRPALNLSITCH